MNNEIVASFNSCGDRLLTILFRQITKTVGHHDNDHLRLRSAGCGGPAVILRNASCSVFNFALSLSRRGQNGAKILHESCLLWTCWPCVVSVRSPWIARAAVRARSA